MGGTDLQSADRLDIVPDQSKGFKGPQTVCGQDSIFDSLDHKEVLFILPSMTLFVILQQLVTWFTTHNQFPVLHCGDVLSQSVMEIINAYDVYVYMYMF